MLLNCVGLLHSRSERARLSALGSFGDLVVLMNREKLLARPSPMGFSDGTSNEARWEKWMRNEIRLRTGYCVWVCTTHSWAGLISLTSNIATGLYTRVLLRQ